MEKLQIAVFGCWNKGCKINSGQHAVSRLLKSKETKYNFMVVLGDNYYPKKETLNNVNNVNDVKIKIKLTEINTMHKGFDCIKDINLEKKIIMGNHDVTESLDKDCSVLRQQLKLPWYDVKFPYSYDNYYVKTNSGYETILFLYLDTTIYEKKINDGNSCYKQVLSKSVEELKDEQLSFITKKLNEITSSRNYNYKNVIFFGHEPLLTYKDNGDVQNTVIKESIIKDLLYFLFKKKKDYPNLNFYWICADYHIYQNTKITHNGLEIIQWIFGTGGGDLDAPGMRNTYTHTYTNDNDSTDIKTYKVDILENIVYNREGIDISSQYQRNGVANYGYGEIIINLSSITHKFITTGLSENNSQSASLELTTAEGGNYYNNKYLKYKNKHINLKNRLLK